MTRRTLFALFGAAPMAKAARKSAPTALSADAWAPFIEADGYINAAWERAIKRTVETQTIEPFAEKPNGR